ncbi:lipopolysaccharide biosynthesis protein [Hwangdonia lutea]|uniref:Oligosaccharide flippase family protein n=1 Tax=Hwangdonia lutea TaxID=3075823 RepID=A0AA97ENQ2_9FLAO|nr:oligosaccharide flippase family protein [Hwangdonia sp. SCSIO 19198]WOD43358.1 oligosaccharide flippase family protein [Hwangdonia sp. SCSIO 19198]
MKINQLKGGAALSYVIIFLTNIVGLVLTPFIIRSLGSAEYGLYTMIGALVGYMSVLDFGLNNTIVRFVAKYKAEGDKKGEENFLAHSFIMYFCISILVTVLGLILYYNLENLYSETLTPNQIEKAKVMMLLLIFNLAISLPGGAFSGICYGYEEFILPKITNIVRYIVRSILVVVILLYGADAVGLVILDTAMNLLVIGVDIYIVFKILKVKIKIHKIDKTLFKSIMGFSLWLFVFAIVHQLRWQFGQMIIGLYYSTSIVAIYAVGITLGNYYGAFSSAISSVFLPRAIQMTVKNIPKEELTNTFIKISRIILLVLFYIFGAFIIIGRDFVFFWVGEEYNSAYYYAMIIMFGLTPILSQGFANNILEAKNLLAYRGKLLLSLTVAGTILSFFIVQKFGVLEMIITIVFFMFLERIIMIFYYNKKTNLDMFRYYKEIYPLFVVFVITTSLIFLFTRSFLPEKNLLVVCSSAMIYSLIYAFIFIRFMTTEYEKSLLKSMLRFLPFFNNNK